MKGCHCGWAVCIRVGWSHICEISAFFLSLSLESKLLLGMVELLHYILIKFSLRGFRNTLKVNV